MNKYVSMNKHFKRNRKSLSRYLVVTYNLFEMNFLFSPN